MNDASIFRPEPFPREAAMEQSMEGFETGPAADEPEEEFRRVPGGRPSAKPPRFGRPPGPRPRPLPRPGKPKPAWPPRRPRQRPLADALPWPGYREPYAVAVEPDGGGAAAQGSEYVRWTQDCLNRVMSMRLPVDGVMTPATRSVVRRFQQRENLPVTGIAGPDTEEALRRACSGGASAGPDDAQADQEWGLERESLAAGLQETEFRQLPGTKVGTAMREALKRPLPGGVVPTYQDAGTLATLSTVPSDKGLYLIAFKDGATMKGYSGKADNLRQRLLQHRHCAQVFGLPLANYRVMIASLKGHTKPDLRETEKRINRFVRANYGDVFTNQRSEVEEAIFAETWN